MSNFISENQIEKAIIKVFTHNLGYRHVNCLENDKTGRLHETDVIIKPLLKKKLIDLNPTLPASAIEEAYEQLSQTRLDKSDLMANKEAYALIKNGVQVEINNAEGRQEPATVKVIDFNEKSNNDYLVVSQLWIQGQFIRRRTDLIVFVNGLPLIFIELKNSNIALRNAYDDNLLNYRKDIPLLFHYNAICILSNGLETKVGSFNSGYEHFFHWLRAENENQVPDKKRIQLYEHHYTQNAGRRTSRRTETDVRTFRDPTFGAWVWRYHRERVPPGTLVFFGRCCHYGGEDRWRST